MKFGCECKHVGMIDQHGPTAVVGNTEKTGKVLRADLHWKAKNSCKIMHDNAATQPGRAPPCKIVYSTTLIYKTLGSIAVHCQTSIASVTPRERYAAHSYALMPNEAVK